MKKHSLPVPSVNWTHVRSSQRQLGYQTGEPGILGPDPVLSAPQGLCSLSPLHPGAPSTWLLQLTSRRLTVPLCLVVFLLLPGFLSAIQFYKLLGSELCLSSSFETVIHSVHPIHRILAAQRLKSLFSKQTAEQAGYPGFSRSCSNGQM